MTAISGPSAPEAHIAGTGPAPGPEPDVLLVKPEEVAALPDGLDDGLLTLPTLSVRPRACDVLTFVDLDTPTGPGTDLTRTAARLRDSTRILVGVAHEPLPAERLPLAEALTVTLSAVPQLGRAHVTVGDPSAESARLVAAVAAAPRAALALAGVLRLTSEVAVGDALVAESLAYSMLQSGPEFAAWRAQRPVRPVPPAPTDPVLLVRTRDMLRMTLNRPDRRNALGTALRDALIEALETLAADPRIRSAELRGNGPDFCSGGDLDEFGTAADPATAHLVRLARSPGRLVHRNAGRVRALVHGACVGAGIEVPAFAGTVIADPGSWFRLPELGMGLIPGAGGTVSLPRRIGRWRTAWMGLTGARVTAAQALEWGLVDSVAPLPPV